MSPEAYEKILLEAPPESWIAFSNDEERVVSYGTNYEEAVQEAEKQGEPDPVLFRTPKEWVRMVLAH